MRATPDKLSPWVEKSACGRDLDAQLEAVATSGQHGAPQVLRAMALGANGFGAAPSQAELALVLAATGHSARQKFCARWPGFFRLLVSAIPGWKRKTAAVCP